MTTLMKSSGTRPKSYKLTAVQSPSEMRDIASRICREYLSGAWKSISAEDIQLKRISGGLSNFLYHVSLPDSNNENNNFTTSPDRKAIKTTANCTNGNGTNNAKRLRKDSFQTMTDPKEVLLRIYGQTHGEHALETMLTESVVFTLLSERKLGPKLHGIFPGGRIEQYIPARALQTNELSDSKISLKIAEKMAEIHSLDIPICKEPEWLWNTMNRWLKSVETILATSVDGLKNTSEKEEANKLSKLNFRQEVQWLRETIERESMPVVFSHNDLQEGNILLREDFSNESGCDPYSSNDSLDKSGQLQNFSASILISSDTKTSNGTQQQLLNGHSRKRSLVQHDSIDNDLDNTRDSVLSGNSSQLTLPDNADPELMIIDFEYCAYNYRGFDLANHFLEWTFDYTNEKFPYFHHRKNQYPTNEQKEQFITVYLSKTRTDVAENQPSASEVNDLIGEVNYFTLTSHLFWAMWGIVNVHQEIEFGYWQYAACRINEYLVEKEKFQKLYPKSGTKDIGDRRK